MDAFELDDFNDLNTEDLFDKFQNMIDQENDDQSEEEIIEGLGDDDCPDCFKDNGTQNTIIYDASEGCTICRECGFIKKELIDQGPDWRQGEDDNKGSRCNAITNPHLPESSIGTQIGGPRSILQRTQGWISMKYRERTRYKVLKDIASKCKKGGIKEKVISDAETIFKIISETKHVSGPNKGDFVIVRGINRKSLIAACVYFACLKNNHTRSPHEIADLFEIEYTDLNKGCKTFSELMELRKQNDSYLSNIQFENNYSKAEDFIERYCVQLHIKKTHAEIATKIARNVEKLKLGSDHTPLSVATASILLTISLNGLSISKKCIANKFGISTVTLDRSYNQIKEFSAVLLDDETVDALVKHREKQRDGMKINTKLDKFETIKTNPIQEGYERMLIDNETSKDTIKATNNKFKEIKNKYAGF